MDRILERIERNASFIVHCNTREEIREFLLYVKQLGVTWNSHDPIRDYDWDKGLGFSFRVLPGGRMMRADREFYERAEFNKHTHFEWADCCIKPKFDEQAFTDLLLGG